MNLNWVNLNGLQSWGNEAIKISTSLRFFGFISRFIPVQLKSGRRQTLVLTLLTLVAEPDASELHVFSTCRLLVSGERSNRWPRWRAGPLIPRWRWPPPMDWIKCSASGCFHCSGRLHHHRHPLCHSLSKIKHEVIWYIFQSSSKSKELPSITSNLTVLVDSVCCLSNVQSSTILSIRIKILILEAAFESNSSFFFLSYSYIFKSCQT